MTRGGRDIPISGKIKKLTHSLGRNLYINQYLTTATSVLHDTDQVFRKSLMADLVGFDISDAELVVERLLDVNKKFSDLDFMPAHEQLLALLEEDSIASVDENIIGLIYIELIKSCICMNDLLSASKWLKHGERALRKFDLFTSVVLELEFIIALRNAQPETARSVVLQAEQLQEVISSEVLTLKWSYYSLLLSFQGRCYKEVIKSVNANPIFSSKMKNALVNVKFLEILSVFHLNDWDWLQYKIDSFRKIISGLDDRFPRIVQTIALLKAQTGGRVISGAEVSKAIILIEQEFPWHPLGLEVAKQTQWAKFCAMETFAVSESESVSAF
jgi:hypothetical protein